MTAASSASAADRVNHGRPGEYGRAANELVPTVADEARRWVSERSDRSSETELVMARDLRDVYLRASSVLTDGEMIGQAAQAIVHDELLDLATRCQAEATRQATWANARIKEVATRALVV